MPLFQNFMAASRKPNMKRFHLFPNNMSLAWIDGANLYAPEVFTHPTTITGTMNGVNPTFVLVGIVDTPALARVIWNGLGLEESVGFTITGGTITMAAGYLPDSGDTLEVLVW